MLGFLESFLNNVNIEFFMVLESLINPVKAESNPWNLFFFGFLYASVSIPLSYWIFEKHASLVMVFLTVITCVPLVYSTIRYEEKKDTIYEKESVLLKEHGKALLFLMFLFLGMTLAYALFYVVLPEKITTSVFGIQTQTILDINNQISGNTLQQAQVFGKIFFNNIKVLSFCLLFSLIYGTGAIFILTWNASVIGTAIGNFIRVNMGSIAGLVGFTKTAAYLHIISLGLLKYTVHGIPEILAYFTGGLAGGIISIAVIKHDFGTTKFEKIVLDSSDLIIISVALLLLAALLEVYVTPVLF
jgi:stage II sporulation protein M